MPRAKTSTTAADDARADAWLALDKQLAASDALVDAAHKERMPILAASASTGWVPSQENWDPQPTWTAGVVLS